MDFFAVCQGASIDRISVQYYLNRFMVGGEIVDAMNFVVKGYVFISVISMSKHGFIEFNYLDFVLLSDVE